MKGDDRVDVADPDKLAPADRAKLHEEEGGGMMGEEPTTDEVIDYAVVHDARSGADQKFVLKYKAASKVGKATGTLKKKYAGLPDAAAFDAWKKQHPSRRRRARRARRARSRSMSRSRRPRAKRSPTSRRG